MICLRAVATSVDSVTRGGRETIGSPKSPSAAEVEWAQQADVAQLVEHHLAKVRVAGSNPVVRSNKSPGHDA